MLAVTAATHDVDSDTCQSSPRPTFYTTTVSYYTGRTGPDVRASCRPNNSVKVPQTDRDEMTVVN